MPRFEHVVWWRVFVKRLLAVLAVILGAIPAMAASYWTLTVDNQTLAAEIPPVAVGSGTLLVSARALCQAMRATYDCDPSGRIRVSRGGSVVEMQEGAPQARVNGRDVRMPTPARREGGVMVLPVPFVAQALGYRAEVNEAAMLMGLTSTSATSASVPSAASSAPLTIGAPASTSAPQSAVPSVLPWLAAGALPASSGLPVMPPSNATAASGPATAVMATATALPQNSGASTFTLPASAYVQLPGDPYRSNAQTDPGTRARMRTDFNNPFVDNSVSIAGTMDVLPRSPDATQEPTIEPEPTPTPNSIPSTTADPAITGLVLERRYDQFVTAYTVRYRVTNLGAQPTEKPLLLRLLVGGKGSLQVMQDIKVDRLDANQSLSFEWSGDARSWPALHDLAVRAQVRLVLDENAADGKGGNNSRSVRLSY